MDYGTKVGVVIYLFAALHLLLQSLYIKIPAGLEEPPFLLRVIISLTWPIDLLILIIQISRGKNVSFFGEDE